MSRFSISRHSISALRQDSRRPKDARYNDRGKRSIHSSSRAQPGLDASHQTQHRGREDLGQTEFIQSRWRTRLAECSEPKGNSSSRAPIAPESRAASGASKGKRFPGSGPRTRLAPVNNSYRLWAVVSDVELPFVVRRFRYGLHSAFLDCRSRFR